MGNSIRAWREKRGLSQTELGRMIGTQAASVSRYEHEDNRVTLPLLRRLAEALQTTPAELIAEVPGDQQVTACPVWGSRGHVLLDGGLFADDHAEGWVPFVVIIEDDAMSPTARRGDIAVANRHAGTEADVDLVPVSGPGLWVLRHGDQAHLRRILVDALSGDLIVATDNPHHAAQHTVPSGEVLMALGRVTHIVQKAR